MNTWTTANIERLKSLHAQGLSNSQIAAELGTTRNTVIGKLSRLSLSNPDRDPVWTEEKIGRVKAGPELQDLPPQPTSSGISLFDIGYGQCRWPLNEVNPISEFRFCGAKSEGSWCKTHKALVDGSKWRMECNTS